MTIDKVQSDTVADTTAIEQPPDIESQAGRTGLPVSELHNQSNVELSLEPSQSKSRDPGELILQIDAWVGTTQRTLSDGPRIPDSAVADLASAVDHAVDFVLGRLA